MRLRDRKGFDKPEIIIIPMIDIMFFLLVFFMLSTLYMVNLKTVDINMPKAANVETQMRVTYVVTMKKDGSLFLEDQPIAEKTLLERAKAENARNGNFSLVLRADQDIDYGMVYALLDKFKGAGITRVGLAGESAGGK